MRIIKGLVIAVTLSSASAAGGEPVDPWRAMLERDLVYLRTTIETRYIYALTEGESFRVLLDANLARAEQDAERVNSYAGYRAVLTRFAGGFADAHVRMRFDLEPRQVQWPGFLVRHQSGRYVTAASEVAGLPDGAALTACDDEPIDALIDEVAPFFGRVAGLESTREVVAPLLFVDADNPLYQRPNACTINGQAVALEWTPVATAYLAELDLRHGPARHDHIAQITPFARNGAWVRIFRMFVESAEEAADFRRIIAEAPSLRGKEIIVLDVRRNGGGEYNWFMAFLTSLYGEAYTNYYARARLQIHPVMIDDPSGGAGDAETSESENMTPAPDATEAPPDVALNEALAQMQLTRRAVGGGRLVYAVEPPPGAPAAPLGPPPPNPVRARVFLLTDAGCGSACIAFVDEMIRFPGVVHVGRETYVDSRTGTPVHYPLPSGLGEIDLPNMVRENRKRGDNEPVRPMHLYDGDISDTKAVRAWIEALAAARRN